MFIHYLENEIQIYKATLLLSRFFFAILFHSLAGEGAHAFMPHVAMPLHINVKGVWSQ